MAWKQKKPVRKKLLALPDGLVGRFVSEECIGLEDGGRLIQRMNREVDIMKCFPGNRCR